MTIKQRLIYAHDLWSYIMMLPHNGDMISSEEVEQAIIQATSVDAVEVVRCGNCKKRPKNVEWGMCHVLCRQTHKDDFCSYGERRS